MSDEAVWTCWSCGALIDTEGPSGGATEPREGVSLNGTNELHVCCICHRSLSVRDRLLFNLAMRQPRDGGLGLRVLIDAAWELIEQKIDPSEDVDASEGINLSPSDN